MVFWENSMVEGTRSLVRPVITLSFVWAYIAACFMRTEALGELETLTGVVVAFWFSAKSEEKKA